MIQYKNVLDKDGTKVVPLFGTVVAVLSEEYPHEVLTANRGRFSVAGW